MKQLADLVADEAETNSAFATKLEAILAPLPQKPAAKSKGKTIAPDVFTEFEAKGGEEFAFWLRTLDIATLKAIVRMNEFDPTKKTARWSDSDKFVPLIVEQVQSRMKRGTAFLSPISDDLNKK